MALGKSIHLSETLFHHFDMEIKNLLTSLLHRTVGRIKLVQTSAVALKHTKHNRNKCEISV